MIFRPSAWAIRNPTPVALLFVALMLLGIAAFFQMPIKAFPNAQFPIIVVEVGLNGAAASEVENQISRPLEAAMAGVNNVRHIDTVASLGQSSMTIEFEYGTDLMKALDDVRSVVDRARIDLPAGIDPPYVQRVDFSSQPILTYAVGSRDMSPSELSWFIDNTLSKSLQAVPGVASVSRVGGLNQEINVTLNPDRMNALGVTAPQVNQALVGANLDAGGGRSNIGDQEQTIRVLGQAIDV
ncbi:MAG: acriflavin resistance protein, partial [Caulobacteraceae bacterium]|nr:acriflavin resistance protein [Caulobacteraceae bacterium]